MTLPGGDVRVPCAAWGRPYGRQTWGSHTRRDGRRAASLQLDPSGPGRPRLRGDGWAGTGGRRQGRCLRSPQARPGGPGLHGRRQGLPTGSPEAGHRPDFLLRVVPRVTGKTEVSAA